MRQKLVFPELRVSMVQRVEISVNRFKYMRRNAAFGANSDSLRVTGYIAGCGGM